MLRTYLHRRKGTWQAKIDNVFKLQKSKFVMRFQLKYQYGFCWMYPDFHLCLYVVLTSGFEMDPYFPREGKVTHYTYQRNIDFFVYLICFRIYDFSNSSQFYSIESC